VTSSDAFNNSLDDESYHDLLAAQALAREHRTEEPAPAGLSAAQAAGIGLKHIAALTGKETTAATSVQPADNGWLICVEVVEDRRIPSSADTLALYEAQIAMDGSLLSYQRRRQYLRSRGDTADGGAR
jgi:hypothetical protein